MVEGDLSLQPWTRIGEKGSRAGSGGFREEMPRGGCAWKIMMGLELLDGCIWMHTSSRFLRRTGEQERERGNFGR